jgi:hypothetical protein
MKMTKTRMIVSALSLLAFVGAANAATTPPQYPTIHKANMHTVKKVHMVMKKHKKHMKHAMLKKAPVKAKAV